MPLSTSLIRNRVSIHEPYEVRDWARKFGVNEQQLREVVQKVGTSADKVAKELGK